MGERVVVTVRLGKTLPLAVMLLVTLGDREREGEREGVSVGLTVMLCVREGVRVVEALKEVDSVTLTESERDGDRDGE